MKIGFRVVVKALLLLKEPCCLMRHDWLLQAIQQAPQQQVKGCLQGRELRQYYNRLIVKYFSDGQLQF